MALKSDLLFPPPLGDTRIQLAYNNRNRPIAFGEPQSTSVGRIQLALVRLGFPMPKSVTPTGVPDGIFGHETLSVVREFQSRNGLRVDGMVGQHTLDKLDELLLKLPPGPPVPPTPQPTHQQTIKDAFEASRKAIGVVLPQLILLETAINLADQKKGQERVEAIGALMQANARNIAVLSQRLFVGGPMTAEFRKALREVIEKTDANLHAKKRYHRGGHDRSMRCQ